MKFPTKKLGINESIIFDDRMLIRSGDASISTKFNEVDKKIMPKIIQELEKIKNGTSLLK